MRKPKLLGRSHGERSGSSARGRRLDLPIYLDAGVALSLSASLGRGLVLESSVERAVTNAGGLKATAGGAIPQIASVKSELEGSRSVAVTESEVRKQTQESITNTTRETLETAALVNGPESWIDFEWRVGDFVDLTCERVIVPLVSVLSRLRVMTETFGFLTSELSTDALEKRIPQLLDYMRSTRDVDRDAGQQVDAEEDDFDIDAFLSALREAGEVAKALSGVVARLEEEAEASGLIDLVMFEKRDQEPRVLVVASLDRDYVDTKLLRRLSQSEFGVLGKVVRGPEPSTAFNAFRNSMLGATNQLPVLLSRLTQRLTELPLLLGDAVFIGDSDDNVLLDFVGSASAITEMQPLWVTPSVELFPIAIYA